MVTTKLIFSFKYTVFTNDAHAGKKLVPSHESEALDDKQNLSVILQSV